MCGDFIIDFFVNNHMLKMNITTRWSRFWLNKKSDQRKRRIKT